MTRYTPIIGLVFLLFGCGEVGGDGDGTVSEAGVEDGGMDAADAAADPCEAPCETFVACVGEAAEACDGEADGEALRSACDEACEAGFDAPGEEGTCEDYETALADIYPSNATLCPPDPEVSRDDGCELDDGTPGVCLATADCEGGGQSSPGFCGGGADVQCCTGYACSGGGFEGTCLQEGDCSDLGGETESGLCNGGNTVKCCDAIIQE